jgi:hypothetical protein
VRLIEQEVDRGRGGRDDGREGRTSWGLRDKLRTAIRGEMEGKGREGKHEMLSD